MEIKQSIEEVTIPDTSNGYCLLNVELSDRELYFIGRIVAAWGSLEMEIFTQTLIALNPAPTDKLPPEMNNMQPSKVHELWKALVVDKATGKKAEVLQKQYELIGIYAKYRHGIVHGMWDWSKSKLERINVSRVRKDTLERLNFTADALMKLSMELDRINYNIRFPVIEDHAAALNESGGYMSRKMAATLSDNPVAKEWPPYTTKEDGD